MNQIIKENSKTNFLGYLMNKMCFGNFKWKGVCEREPNSWSLGLNPNVSLSFTLSKNEKVAPYKNEDL